MPEVSGIEPSIMHIEETVALAPYDETLLDVCRTRWQFADWQRLAASNGDALQHHPDRAKIALLVAAARFQLGHTQQAHRLLKLALDWGASRCQAAQMPLPGVHQSLVEALHLMAQRGPALEHFRQAIRVGGVPGDVELLAQARELRSTSFAK